MKAKTTVERKTKKTSHQKNIPNKQLSNKWNNQFIGLALLILIGVIIYADSFNCSFHFDDTQSIVNKTAVHNLSDIGLLWKHDQTRFIPYLSFALNYHFGQLDVWGYHLINLIIHLINSCLVLWITLMIFSSPKLKSNSISKHKNSIALVAGLLFVSHPLATESVTYIIQRMASLVTLFYFFSIAFYMKGRLCNKDNNLKYLFYFGSFISAILSFYSKENASTLPFAILLVEFFFFRTKSISINFKNYRTILIFVGFICFVLVTLLKFHNQIFKSLSPDIYDDYRTISPLNYLFTQFSVIVKYIQLFIFPFSLNFDYDYPLSTSFFEPKTIICFLVLLSLIILAIYLYNRHRILSFGIFWFFLTLAVESSIVPISDLIYEHRTYLPSLGIFIILSYCVHYFLWDKYRNVAVSLIILIVGMNSYLTYQRNKVYLDEETLYHDTLEKSPGKSRPYSVLGSTYYTLNKFDTAMTFLNKAIEIQPQNYNAYYLRGNVFGAKKKNKEAMDDYNKSIEYYPKFYRVYNNRGNIFKDEMKYDEAYKDYDKALKLNPEYSEAYNNRGTTLIDLHKLPEAISDFHNAIKYNTNFAIAYANLAVAELNSGDKGQACNDFKKAVDLGFAQAQELYNQFCK